MPDVIATRSPLTEAIYPPAISLREDLGRGRCSRSRCCCSSTSSAPTRAPTSLVRATTSTSSCTTAVTCSASPATEARVTTCCATS